jgi:hypothetical protein
VIDSWVIDFLIEGCKSNAVQMSLKRSPPLRLDQLEWFAFMPAKDAYFASFRLDDGQRSYRWHGVPESLDAYLGAVASVGIASLSVGKHGCWVIILSDGTVDGVGITPSLQEKLQASQGHVGVQVRTQLISLHIDR